MAGLLFAPLLWSQSPRSLPQLPESPENKTSLPSLDDARREIQANHFAQAEGELRLYLLHDEGSASAHYILAYSLLRQAKAKEALEQYTRAAALRKPTGPDLRGVGQAYLILEDYTDADKWFQRSLQMNPADADTWYNLGRLRYAQNRFAESLEAFTHALTLVPKSSKVENNLGLALEGLNRLPEAEAAYRQAIVWQDADREATAREQPLLNLGIVVLHRGDLAEAQALFERAVVIAPKDPRIQEQLGQVYLKESKFALAQTHLADACRLDPGKGNLHFLLGQADKRLGQDEKARQEFAEAARLSSVSSQQGK